MFSIHVVLIREGALTPDLMVFK